MPNAKDAPVLKKYRQQNPWGLSTCIDLYSCNVTTIRSEEKIKQFVDALCLIIKAKKYGECVLVDFGENERVTGYSLFQLIETSAISGHFGNQSNGAFAYLDIFSCKEYPPYKAANFAKKFFQAKSMRVKIIFRY